GGGYQQGLVDCVYRRGVVPYEVSGWFPVTTDAASFEEACRSCSITPHNRSLHTEHSAVRHSQAIPERASRSNALPARIGVPERTAVQKSKKRHVLLLTRPEDRRQMIQSHNAYSQLRRFSESCNRRFRH